VNDNGNGNGHKKRIVVDLWRMSDAVCFPYAIGSDGTRIPSDYIVPLETDRYRRYACIWLDVPPDAVVIRVVEFVEGGGFWTPLQMPAETPDPQVVEVEGILNDHGLSLVRTILRPKKYRVPRK